jgi:hypothetical protein
LNALDFCYGAVHGGLHFPGGILFLNVTEVSEVQSGKMFGVGISIDHRSIFRRYLLQNFKALAESTYSVTGITGKST